MSQTPNHRTEQQHVQFIQYMKRHGYRVQVDIMKGCRVLVLASVQTDAHRERVGGAA